MRRLGLFCLILLGGSLVRLYLTVVRPLHRLAVQAQRLSSGDFTALAHSPGGVSDLETLRTAMNAMVGHVRRVQAQERAYIEALTNGQEAERARIARELHDDTTQSLIAIAQNLEMAQEAVGPDTEVGLWLQATREQALETVNNLRRLIADLRPPALEELGLVPALQMLAEQTHVAQVTVDIAGPVRRLNEDIALALFRSAQEALRNATRHGQAQHVDLRLVFRPAETLLTIYDDGCGFVAPGQLENLAGDRHYGLVGIVERIQRLDGLIQINSAPGRGTQLEIALPTQEDVQPEGIVRDPVCSALIEPHQAYASVDYEGVRYYFCCPVCQGAFQADPTFYLRSTPSP